MSGIPLPVISPFAFALTPGFPFMFPATNIAFKYRHDSKKGQEEYFWLFFLASGQQTGRKPERIPGFFMENPENGVFYGLRQTNLAKHPLS